MGYYDETNLTNNDDQNSRRKKERKGFSNLSSGFVGAIIGAVTIALISPAILNQNNNNALQTNQQTQTIQVTNVSRQNLTSIIANAKQSVVGVNNYQSSNPFSMESEEAGSGSGVVYKLIGGKALIATNNHVVEGASELKVKMPSGQLVPAKLVGTDPLLDLAVVQVDARYVNSVAKLGNSDNINAGDTAIAIGNPLGFLEGTVTEGIISSKAREIPQDLDGDGVADNQAKVIQTDASINPGNSGGALLNAKGEVIGINSSKIAEQSVEGIGFAIPINVAKPILDQIEKFGEVTRPVIGVGLKALNEIPQFTIAETLKLPKSITNGAVVTEVNPGSAASKAGLRKLDVIVELDGKPVNDVLGLREYLYANKKVGDKMSITFYRGGSKHTVKITLGSKS
jgi:serine protease Do